MRWAICMLLLAVPLAVVFGDPPAERTLKKAYPDFIMGVAIPAPKAFKPEGLALVKTHFGALVPTNCMKAGPVHPEEKKWDFELADSLVDFAQENKMEVFGHTLVWHNQAAEWMFQDAKDPSKKATREVVLARLKEHITTLVGRYKGKIRGWDVVNEALSDRGDEYLKKTKWTEIVGDDFVEQAFRFANQADPKAELQYNDYGIEYPGKRKKTMKLVKSLLDKGIPVTSIGIQAHYALDKVPLKELDEAIKEFRTLNGGRMKVAITELDMNVLPNQGAGAAGDGGKAKEETASPEVLKRQAEQYAQLFTLFRKHKADLVRVTFWGLDDAHSWLNAPNRFNHPLLWDRDGKPKPAFDAVLNAAK